MNSREKILEAVLNSQPELSELPDISMFKGTPGDTVRKYMEVFQSISGTAFLVENMDDIKKLIQSQYDVTKRIVTNVNELSDTAELFSLQTDPHTLQDIEVAIIQAHFAVAENGAVWLTEELMGQRIIPYICQHLAVIIKAEQIVPTLHEAYEIIGAGDYGFGGFIGGPSKTADIEQALVLGAHGPLTMTVYILK